MKTTPHYSQVPQTEKPMEAFPKPNTIPSGWDMSDMNTDASTSVKNATKVEFTKVSESISCPNH